MNNRDMKRFAIKASVFGVISIALMLQRSATKHILITDAAGVNVDRAYAGNSYNVLIDRNVSPGQSGKLVIPLPKSVSSDDIVLEDRYIDHELLIYIDSRDEGFYLDNAVVTDLDIFEEATCYQENDSGSVCLDFKLNDLYANESSLTENSTIEVGFFRPADKYDRIVVVDPAGGGSAMGNLSGENAEKDIALDVAMSLKSISEKEPDSGIKFYYTRHTDTDVDSDKRSALIKDCQADILVEIGAEVSADPYKNGIETYYNENFFIRKFNNAEFADILERNCSSRAGATALGVYPADETDRVLMDSKIPSAKISVGYLGGSTDSGLVIDKSYQKKAAEGIYFGIKEALEEMK